MNTVVQDKTMANKTSLFSNENDRSLKGTIRLLYADVLGVGRTADYYY